MADHVPVKILIVDDREEIILAMESSLHGPDRLIISARSGNEALGILLEQEVALILLGDDLHGMTGFETAELIRGSSRTRHIPIIFLNEPEPLGSKVQTYIDLHLQKAAFDNITRRLEATTAELIDARTSLRQSEQNLRLSNKEAVLARESAEQAYRSKTDFLAHVSHEIRTPLSSIIGMADLALLESGAPQLRERLESIKQSGESLMEILNEILDLSKIETEHVELESISFNPVEIVERVSRMISVKIYEKNLQLICKIDPSIPAEVIGDPTRFRHIIHNLLTNAYKFTEKGHIRMEVSLENATNQAVVLGFQISDTGIGIHASKLKKIFEPNPNQGSVSDKGPSDTGLGLAVTKKLVDLMKGEIRVESDLESGTSFYFSIPFGAGTGITTDQEIKSAVLGRFSPMAVIVRNPDSIESVRCAFDSLPVDYRIISETDPESEGIRACLENHKLILVDSEVRMSHGKPLYTGLATVFENLKGIPVFLMAPGTLNVNKDSLQSQGLSGLIRKPLFPRDILAVLDEFARNPLPGFSPEQKVLSDIPEGQSLKILLAEDNPINTKLAVGLIQLRNWKVDCAVNGAEAVDKFRIRTYDLVLMDIQMPELDGLEATKKIREIEVFRGSNPTPVIAVSAHALKGDIEKALNSGMDDYIIKPFKPNELYSMIEKYTCKRTENEPI